MPAQCKFRLPLAQTRLPGKVYQRNSSLKKIVKVQSLVTSGCVSMQTTVDKLEIKLVFEEVYRRCVADS